MEPEFTNKYKPSVEAKITFNLTCSFCAKTYLKAEYKFVG